MSIRLSRVSVFCEGLDHPECVAVHRDGSVWAGGEAGQIYRISPDGKTVQTVANTGGFVLGIAFSPDCSWLAICDSAKPALLRLDLKSGKLSLFADGVGSERFKMPNHLCFAMDGTLYVTDSGTFRKIDGRIFRFDADHSGAGQVWHKGPFNFANGCALNADESALFVNCTWLPGVERVEIAPDGSAGPRRVLARLPHSLPDGMAFDSRGNLYISCYTPARVYKISPSGTASTFIDDWDAHHVGSPTNIAFGGKQLKTMFLANLAQWHLSQVQLRLRGLALPHQRPAKATRRK